MTDDPVLKAVQNFMDAVEARLSASDTEIRGLATEVRGLLTELQTRATPTEGPPGKDGKNGIDGKNGANGKDGAPGERGADGIATREELDSIIDQRVAEIQVRTFADVYQGVYKPDTAYTRGLLVTWGGSLWLSQLDTRQKPGEGSDWRLVVKKGADAKR